MEIGFCARSTIASDLKAQVPAVIPVQADVEEELDCIWQGGRASLTGTADQPPPRGSTSGGRMEALGVPCGRPFRRPRSMLIRRSGEQKTAEYDVSLPYSPPKH